MKSGGSNFRHWLMISGNDLMAHKAKYPLKLTGSINWVSCGGDELLDIDVKRALFRTKDEIVLSFHAEGSPYDASLKRTSGSRFEATFPGPNNDPIIVSCNLYSSEDGYFLFGKWTENTYDNWWWAGLRKIERFANESPARAS